MREQKVPIKFVEVEGSITFTYVEEGMREEDSCEAPLSSTNVDLNEVTHIDETVLPVAPASNSGRASQAASISVNMDPASKRMVDDLVDSETTDDGEDAGFVEQLTDEIPHSFADPRHFPSPSRDVADETSYDLIGSSTVREHFGDLQAPIANKPPRPPLPSITNSPFALQPGEETPGSRPSTTKRKAPSHSQRNSQTRFPLQRRSLAHSVHSSPSNASSVPDPTAPPGPYANGSYRNQPHLNNAYPSVQNYTRGPKIATKFGEHHLHADEPNFLSLEVFEGSTWGGSDQNGRRAANIMTPPNGQGAG